MENGIKLYIKRTDNVYIIKGKKVILWSSNASADLRARHIDEDGVRTILECAYGRLILIVNAVRLPKTGCENICLRWRVPQWITHTAYVLTLYYIILDTALVLSVCTWCENSPVDVACWRESIGHWFTIHATLLYYYVLHFFTLFFAYALYFVKSIHFFYTVGSLT